MTLAQQQLHALKLRALTSSRFWQACRADFIVLLRWVAPAKQATTCLCPSVQFPIDTQKPWLNYSGKGQP